MTSTFVARNVAPEAADGPAAPTLDVVVPVHNEAAALERSVRRLHHFLETSFPYRCRITIVDNASTDPTATLASHLADQLPDVRVASLPEKGRGRALRQVWSASDAPVVAYMDVDLSTDLAALLPLVAPLVSGHSDVAIGTRLSRGAYVVRGPKRELISRGYNLLLHAALGTRFSDAQCGFKALRTDCAKALLPLVRDDEWFFDTELLVLAERAGLRIHEVPVDWVDDVDSRVELAKTALADARGVARLARDLMLDRIDMSRLDRLRPTRPTRPMRTPRLSAQLLWFAVIGVISTVGYVAVYASARQVLPAQLANGIALLVTAVANTAANRRWTFGTRGRSGLARQHLQGLAVLLMALLMTAGSLAALHATDPKATRATEVGVLVAANVVAAGLRFLALRGWVFATAAVSR